jgi:hypothetical protein
VYGWVTRNLRHTTKYLVRRRRGKERHFERSAVAVPFVGRHRTRERRPVRQFLWLTIPGAVLFLFGFATGRVEMRWDAVDFVMCGVSLAFGVNAWVASAPRAVRIIGAVCGFSWLVYRVAFLFA